jgi:hypothetical protein
MDIISIIIYYRIYKLFKEIRTYYNPTSELKFEM